MQWGHWPHVRRHLGALRVKCQQQSSALGLGKTGLMH
jgi:hypothetical protein